MHHVPAVATLRVEPKGRLCELACARGLATQQANPGSDDERRPEIARMGRFLRSLEHGVHPRERLIRVSQMPKGQSQPQAAHDQRVLDAWNRLGWRNGADKALQRLAPGRGEFPAPEGGLTKGAMDVRRKGWILEPLDRVARPPG